MVRQRNVQDFVVTDRVERKGHMQYDRIALEKHFYVRNKSGENSKFEALDAHAE